MPVVVSSSRTSAKREKLRAVLRALVSMYGPRVWQPPTKGEGALGVLVEAMLAQNTNMANATRGYRMLRRRYGSWTKVMDAPVRDVQREIAICGLARMRARRLQDLLRTIKQQRGRLGIDFLADQDVRAGSGYLLGFHGIGPKTAAFTLLFAFNHPVLPVDNGVLRVVRRLRLVRPKARDAEAERVLSPLIEPGSHYPLHVLMFKHAQERCRPRNPKCDECALLDLCPSGKRRGKHRPVDAVGEAPVPGRRVRRAILSRMISGGVPKHGGNGESEREREGHAASGA